MSSSWMKKSVVLSALLLMALPVVAFAQTSRLEGMTLQGDYVKSLEAEAEGFGELFASKDAREGMTAFVEKREPDFTGR